MASVRGFTDCQPIFALAFLVTLGGGQTVACGDYNDSKSINTIVLSAGQSDTVWTPERMKKAKPLNVVRKRSAAKDVVPVKPYPGGSGSTD